MYYYLVYPQDNDIVANIASDILRLRQDGHCPFLDMAELKQQQTVKLVLLIYDVCSFEEDSRRDLKIKTPRMFLVNQQGITYCKNCKIPSHNTVSNIAIRKVEGFGNLTYFGIMHL